MMTTRNISPNTVQMGREELEAFLRQQKIPFETQGPPPIFTVEEGRAFEARLPGAHSKNLFLKDAKGQLWLISAQVDSQINLKTLPKIIGSARLSFGKPDLMQASLGVVPGAVTALALVNDPEQHVRFVLDRVLAEAEAVNFHPLRNDATTNLSAAAFRAFFRALDRSVTVVDFQAETAEEWPL